jgi:hypothetical protein
MRARERQFVFRHARLSSAPGATAPEAAMLEADNSMYP